MVASKLNRDDADGTAVIERIGAVAIVDRIETVVAESGTEFALLSGVAIACLVGVVVGVRNLQDAYAIWANDPIPAGEVHTAETVVEVEGTAEPIEGTIESPYDETTSLVYSYKKERRRTEIDEDGNEESHWETVDSGRNAVPFRVSDDSGSVPVDPEGSDFEAGKDYQSRSGSVRRTERRLVPGDTVHVYGQKREVVEGDLLDDRRQYVGDGQQVTTFQITEGGELHAIGWTAGKGAVYTLVSVVVAVAVGNQFVVLLGYGPGLFG